MRPLHSRAWYESPWWLKLLHEGELVPGWVVQVDDLFDGIEMAMDDGWFE